MENLEYDHEMNNGYVVHDDNDNNYESDGLVKRHTLNEMYQSYSHGITPWARRKKICEYALITIIYLCYLGTLGMVMERMFLEDSGASPDTTTYIFCQVYVILLTTLFTIKLIYYAINLWVWCNPKIDPHGMFALKQFRLLMTVGMFQFILFVVGLVLFFFVIDDTYDYVGTIVTKGYPDMVIFMKVFLWLVFLHAFLYSLYFFFYLLFIIIVYYYFKKFDGFSQYMQDVNEFQDDESDEELSGTVRHNSVKEIEGMVRKERSISKLGVQRVIYDFLQKSNPYMFKLRSRVNKHEALLTYKQIDNLIEFVD